VIRARRLGLALLLALAALAGVLVDAARRREGADATRARAIVAATGLADLALSSSVRWLRHPSQAEPGAPFSDAPASLDVDPAGAWIGPPRPVLSVGAVEVRVRRRP
jgi:hypothetical protein